MNRNPGAGIAAAATQRIEESKYWMNRLSGELTRSCFPVSVRKVGTGSPSRCIERADFNFSPGLTAQLLKIINKSDYRLHMVLTAAAAALLYRYTGNSDIILGSPVYRQDQGGKLINTTLVLRNQIYGNSTFKELLLQVKDTVIAAVKHQNYPVETILYKLGIPSPGQDEEFPLFDVMVVLENIHDRRYAEYIHPNLTFSFTRNGEIITGMVIYDSQKYKKVTVEGITDHFTRFLEQVAFNAEILLREVEILSSGEKRQLLMNFNGKDRSYPGDQTIHQCFTGQVERTPHSIAVVGPGASGTVQDAEKCHAITYRELNRKSDQLGRLLRQKGVGRDSIVGIMTHRTIEMIVGIMAVLKAGGAYLPIDTEYPRDRLRYMLDNCELSILLTTSEVITGNSFTGLQNLRAGRARPVITGPRLPVQDLDTLPMPDRSLVDYEKYSRKISLAMVKHCISLQGTRGCPYDCAYCAKLWSKKHVVRSAEHLFTEVQHYYKMGIRRFSIIDDIFNLDINNSKRFFQLIIDNGLEMQILFPAGLRGDIMTADYIDLMVKAGTINISVALETASPRLQKMIKKNLNVSRLKENLRYICKKHPQVILDLFTMHGFPTETEAEALETLEFIKSLKWLHFPLINILKIYPDTDMEKLAIQSGISREVLLQSMDLAWHEYSGTLPFGKNFTVRYQADFLNEYFLLKERLLRVLPYQMKVLTEDEIVQKYNSYLPEEIKNFGELLSILGISREDLRDKDGVVSRCVAEECFAVPGLNVKIRQAAPVKQADANAFRVLLLDLSQSFCSSSQLLDELYEPPLGLMYLLTWLNRQLGSKISGKIARSGVDFDSFEELEALLQEFRPRLIGIRTLTFYRDFFHQTVSLIRQWGIDVPVVAGGPYATNGYMTLLQDRNIDLVVLSEGELTFTEVVEAVMANNGKLPEDEILRGIRGIAYVPRDSAGGVNVFAGEVILMDQLPMAGLSYPAKMAVENLVNINQPTDLAYVIYTSGSTGQPRGVMIEHRNVNNLVAGLDEQVYHRYGGDRGLHVGLLAPYVFDASVKQIFAALLLGHGLYLIPEGTRLDGVSLLEFYKRESIDISDGTPGYLQVLVESMPGKCLDIDVKHFLIGGEELSVPIVQRFFKACNRDNPLPVVTNVYGPTECSVDATCFEVSPDQYLQEKTFPIGQPLPNISIYIVDRDNRLQPVEVVGELCIGGVCVGRGYINHPELAADRFINQKFLRKMAGPGGETTRFFKKSPPGRRRQNLYRTGDLGRWLENKNIEFIGRIDRQVKIRGFRIELEEIENRLLTYPGIKDAVVTAVMGGSTGEDRCICAYFTCEYPIESSQLREYLSRYLPEYMVPWKFVNIESIPLTPNGKVDKKALPVPAVGEGGSYLPPVTFIEKKLVQIWSGVLGIDKERISIDEDFFELGGHSLRAVILVSRIHKELKVKIPLEEVFTGPVIKNLALYIEAAAEERYMSIEPVEKREYYALSSAQKRLYVLHRMGVGSTFYNKPYVMLLEGFLEFDEVEEVFRRLIRRHDSFRTSFIEVEEEPVQRVYDEVDFEIQRYEQGQGQDPEKEWRERKIKEFIRPFDLSRAPLVRVGIIRENPDRHLLLVDLHHITSDGFSMEIVVNEFMKLLQGEELMELRLQYKDYTHWQDSEDNRGGIRQQQTYWQGELCGEIPVLNIHPDFPRPGVQSFAGDRVHFEFSPGETGRLNVLAKEEDASLYMVMLAIYYILLSKLSGQEDIIIGTPVVGRRHADLEHVVGMFVNTLALRNYPGGGKTFKEFLADLRQGIVQAFDNQDYQFETLLENLESQLKRDMSRNPLFDVLFALQRFDIPDLRIPGLKLSPFGYENLTAKFDLNLMGTEQGEMLQFSLEYCTALFKRETILRYIEYFKSITAAVLDDVNSRIYEIEIVSLAEKERILYGFNDTVADYPGDKSIHWLFREQVLRNPDRVALAGEMEAEGARGKRLQSGGSLSYCELDRRSGLLACFLQTGGVTCDTIVGIIGNRSLEMVTGILAILRAGGAYLPVDPEYPGKRIRYMQEESAARIILTAGLLNEEIERIETSMKEGQGKPGSGIVFSRDVRAADLAYVMYTSGSTGHPKGVMVSHRNVIRLVKNSNFVELSESTRILQTGAPVFDATTFELWGSLLNGGMLYLPDNRVILEGRELGAALRKYFINTLWLSSPLFNQLMRQGSDIFSSLTYLLVGGDVLSAVNINRVRRENFKLSVINGYGPTENTTFSVCYRIDRDYEGGIPLGSPISNSFAYVVDRHSYLQPIGVPGELVVGGDGVSRGYMNKPELTREKYINYKIQNTNYKQITKHKLQNTIVWKSTNKKFLRGVQGGSFYKKSPPGRRRQRLYKTGDLARWQLEGNIEFLGRIDHQVKIRGYRVEIKEIEMILSGHQLVRDVVVLSRADEHNENYLCAYVVTNLADSMQLAVQGESREVLVVLREYLSGELPRYMMPSYFVELEEIPLNPNGKIDIKALPEHGKGDVDSDYVASRDEIEEKLVGIWSEVLGIESSVIGIYDDFFELGGHSLKATLLASRVSKAFSMEFLLTDVFTGPSIFEFAEKVRESGRCHYERIVPVEKQEYYLQSSAQKRLFFLEQFETIGTSYNIPSIFMVEGELDISRFEQSIHNLVSRHETLRTSFGLVNNQPVQRVHDRVKFEIEYYDLRKTGAGAGGNQAESDLISTFIRSFDLSGAPLFRVGLAGTGENRYLLFTDIHHIICDGISIGVLVNDFFRFYPGEEQLVLELQYKDFSQWQHARYETGVVREQEKYWLDVFSDFAAGDNVPRSTLPTDFPRPESPSFAGGGYEFKLGSEDLSRFKQLGDRNGATLYMNLLAIFNVLLFKYTGREDIILGSGASGRSHDSLQHIIGMFVNTLPMRNHPGGGMGYRDFLVEVKKNSLKAFANQDIPFEELVDRLNIKRELSRNPLFDVEFNLQDFEKFGSRDESEKEVGDLRFRRLPREKKTSKFDMILFAEEKGDELILFLEYSSALFKRDTIKEIAGHYLEILTQVVENEDILLKDIRLSYNFVTVKSEIAANEFGF